MITNDRNREHEIMIDETKWPSLYKNIRSTIKLALRTGSIKASTVTQNLVLCCMNLAMISPNDITPARILKGTGKIISP